MEAIQMIKERRSVRKFKNEKVDRELMKEIVEASRFAPSWGNFQVARYTMLMTPQQLSASQKRVYMISFII